MNKMLLLRQETLRAYSAAGINISKVVQQSVKLNFSLAKTKIALEAIYKSAGSRFFQLLTKGSDTFRRQLYANMPKIINALEKFVGFVFKAFEATVILGNRLWGILSRVYEFFVSLHKATEGWSTVILGALAAWKLLNLGFLATPFGMLIAGFTALLALWDDFKTFKEGGQSLINWGSDVTKMVVGVVTVLGGLAAAIGAVRGAILLVTAAQWAWNVAMTANPIGLIIAGLTALLAAIVAVDAKWKIFGGNVSEFFTSIGGKVLDFLGGASGAVTNPDNPSQASNVGANVAANIAQNAAINSKPTSALGATPNVANSQTSNNLNYQTSIIVNSTADAQSVGKAVASEQPRVNFDVTRNMGGATR